MNNCLCIIDNEFNFTLSYKDNGFIFNDFSNWSEIQDINAKVPIKIKKGNTEKQILIFPGQATFLNYSNLIKGECDYDGVYEFEITTCSNTQILSMNYYILNNVECAYYNLIIKEDWDNAKKLLEYIELIKANAFFHDFTKADEFYSIAVKFIKKLNCNC